MGAFIVIVSSRLYVDMGYPLGIFYHGYMIHHIYYGIAILLLSWFILALTDYLCRDILDRFLSFMIGAGLGFIFDEINFIYYWRDYSFSDYSSFINIFADLFLISVLLMLWKFPSPDTISEEDIS